MSVLGPGAKCGCADGESCEFCGQTPEPAAVEIPSWDDEEEDDE